MSTRKFDHRLRLPALAAICIALLVFLTLGPSSTALAWDDCPKGVVNDPYPGLCSRYIDTNGDGICDHSQPAPTTTTTADSATTASTVTGTIASTVTDTTAAESTTTTDSTATTPAVAGTTPPSTPSGGIQYNVSPIAVGFLVVYGLSFVLYRTKRIRVATHRKVWNVLLLATFLMTGVLGLILAIRLNYGIQIRLPFDMLFWHVETGIVMTFISFFHIGWHLKYYRSIFRRGHASARNAANTASSRTGKARLENSVSFERDA